MVLYIIGYALIGTILGIIFALLFIRNDKQWVSFATSAGSLGILFTAFFGMNSALAIDNSAKGGTLVAYLAGFLLSMVLFFCVFSRLLKTQSEKLSLRMLDIFLGRNKTLEEYYEFRKAEISNDLNISGLEERARSLEEKNNQVELKIQRDEKIINTIHEAQDNTVHYKIEASSIFPLTQTFADDIPQLFEKCSKFISEIAGLTTDFIKGAKSESMGKQEIDAYFIALCVAINKTLFINNISGVRSHVRILDCKRGVYAKVVSVEGDDTVSKKPLTDIPENEGMIFHAFQEKTSLIKSYNPEWHYGSTNSQWYDYLTIPLYDVEDSINGTYRPFISMGVSIRSGYNHEEVLVFLHIMKIERLIQREVKNINSVVRLFPIYNSCEERSEIHA